MNKKTKKKIRQLIKEFRANDQTDKEIYNKLAGEYDDGESIARLIVTTVKPKDKKQHRLYIGILLGFTAIVLLFNIWIIRKAPFMYLPDSSFWSFMGKLYLFIGTYVFGYAVILNIISKKQITYYIFWIYSASYLIFCFLLRIFVTLTFEWGIYWLYLAIDLISIFLIIFLALFFQSKIFPNYRYKRLKQDKNGKYIFS
jgi:hypothetical protein